jgi:hypothetical protein
MDVRIVGGEVPLHTRQRDKVIPQLEILALNLVDIETEAVRLGLEAVRLGLELEL